LVERDEAEDARLKGVADQETDKDIRGMLRSLPEFNGQEHHIMCSELKQLYTAITRARVRVVIYDEDPAARAPLFYYFERLGLCDKITILEDSAAPGFVKETSAEEWRVRGQNLMENKVFPLAAQCFQKSGDAKLENRAIAMTLLTRDEPLLRRDGKHKELADLFLEAAERLLAGDSNKLKVADCFYKAGMEAREAMESTLAKSYFELAGSAYISSGDLRVGFKRAVICLQRAEQFDKCVKLLVDHGRYRYALKLLYDQHKYDRALELLKSHPEELDFVPPHELCKENLLQLTAKAHALSANDKKRSETSRKESFEKFKLIIDQMSAEDAESQLLMHGYKDHLIERLEEAGNFGKAARLLSTEDKREEAARILCDKNPAPSLSDLTFGTELLLAHVVHDAHEEQRVAVLKRVQLLQSRMHDLANSSKDPQALKLMQAQAMSFKIVKYRLSKVHGACDMEGGDALVVRSEQGFPPTNERRDALVKNTLTADENVLARVLCGYEAFSSKQFQDPETSSLVCPELNALLKEALELIDGIDSILASAESKDEKMLEHLRWEEFFGISRTMTGVCTITRSRKTIMDWMLERDEGNDKISTQPLVVNAEGDFIMDPGYFKSALSEYLLIVRRRVLVKTSRSLRSRCNHLANLSDKKCEHNAKTSECRVCAPCMHTERLQNLLLVILLCLTNTKKRQQADKMEATQICVGDTVELRGLKSKESVGNGMEAVVEKIHRLQGTELKSLGLSWKEIQKKPKTGIEISNTALATALQHKRKFNKEEFKCFDLDSTPTCNNFVNVGAKYFAPAPLVTVICTQEMGHGQRLSLCLDEDHLRHVDSMSHKKFKEACLRLEAYLTDECPGQEYRIGSLLPAFLLRQHVELVLRGLRDFLWKSFSDWCRVPSLNDRSARTLRGLLLMIDWMGDVKESVRMLTSVDRDCKRLQVDAWHPFSDLVQAHLHGFTSRRSDIQALFYMRSIKAHSHAFRASRSKLSSMPPQADALRLVLNALVLSLVDLGRLDVRTYADKIRFEETTSAVLLPDSMARSLSTSKLGKEPTGVETLVCAMQNLATILEISREDSQLSTLPSITVAAISHLISLIPLNYLISNAPDFPSPNAVRWALVSPERWEELSGLMDAIQKHWGWESQARSIRRQRRDGKTFETPQIYTLSNHKVSCDDPESLLHRMAAQGDPLVILKYTSAGFTQDPSSPTTAVLRAWTDAGLERLKTAVRLVVRQPVSQVSDARQRTTETAPPTASTTHAQEAIDSDRRVALSADAPAFAPLPDDWTLNNGFEVEESVRLDELELEREERAVGIIVAFFRSVRWKKRRHNKAVALAEGANHGLGATNAAGMLSLGQNLEQFDRYQRLKRYVSACNHVCVRAHACIQMNSQARAHKNALTCFFSQFVQRTCAHAHIHAHIHAHKYCHRTPASNMDRNAGARGTVGPH
jgi:hypothetical protein